MRLLKLLLFPFKVVSNWWSRSTTFAGPHLKWWLIVIPMIIGAIICWELGYIEKLQQEDKSFFSFGIIGILIYMSVLCGIQTRKLGKTITVAGMELTADKKMQLKKIEAASEVGWFASDQCLTLGMIGTVIGFIMVLSNSFANIDAADPASLQRALDQISMGVGTALWTTLVGLISSMLIKLQYFNLSHSLDHAI